MEGQGVVSKKAERIKGVIIEKTSKFSISGADARWFRWRLFRLHLAPF
jgi:hypothetical protein